MVNTTLFVDLNSTWNPLAACQINQAEMMAEIERLPTSAYYILLFGLVALLFYFFVQPYLSKSLNEALYNYIGILGVSLVFLSAWVFALYVFEFGEEQLKAITKVASFLIAPLLLLLGYVAYRRFRK